MGLDMYITSRKSKDTWNSLVYWRQFNAVHAWFVNNVQNGVDDCGKYVVSQKKIVELIDLLKQVKDTKDTSLLPTGKGFFFGSDADDYYREQDLKFIKDAKAELFFGFKVFYNSSW